MCGRGCGESGCGGTCSGKVCGWCKVSVGGDSKGLS